MRKKFSRNVLVVSSMVALGTLAGSALAARVFGQTGNPQPIAFDRPAQTSDALPALDGGQGAFAPSESRRVATFGASDPARSVYLTRSANGKLICLWDIDAFISERGGGCNPATDFFAENDLVASLDFSGGPSLDSVTSARLIGLVTSRVAMVKVIDSRGQATTVGLSRDRAFAFSFPASKLSQGVEPVAIVAYDASGTEIARQKTAIT